MIALPDRITGAWLNSLSLEGRATVMRGPFGQRMHRWAASFVTFIRWHERSPLRTLKERSGSIFFLAIDENLFGVTAAHVYRGYLEAKGKNPRAQCWVENLEFNPEQRLRSIGHDVDIAIFDFSYEELRKVGKQALSAASSSWPPPHPFSGQGAYLVGYPGASRFWIGWRSVSYGVYVGSTVINSASDQQITCPFTREYWIDILGNGLPPRGFDLGGISGGPLLIPMDKDGEWNFYLGGVIFEARTTPHYETVISAAAHFITADGTIDEKSAPVRLAVPATLTTI